MATFFRNKIIKNVGTQPIEIFSVTPGSSVTIVGIALTNLTPYPVRASLLLRDDTSIEGYFIKDTEITPNSSLRALMPGEKLILPADNALKVVTDLDDSVDCTVSFVEIV